MAAELRVLLFLCEGFEDLEAAAVRDVLGWTDCGPDFPRVSVVTSAFRPVVHGRFGTAVRCDVAFSEVDPADYAALALPGGFYGRGFEEAHTPQLHDLIRDFHTRGRIIATFCVGVLPVAETGLLRGKRATTYPYSRNHDHLARLRELGAEVVEGPIAEDGGVISCRGPAQAVQVALLLLERLRGVEMARAVARLMGHAE